MFLLTSQAPKPVEQKSTLLKLDISISNPHIILPKNGNSR
jgi:hypothetical protein